MVEYWQGNMNWELNKAWKCETCELNAGLTWGLVHGQCRCNSCHTQYRMRDKDDNMVDTPICNLKKEYREPAKHGWKKLQKPLTEFTAQHWEGLFAELNLQDPT